MNFSPISRVSLRIVYYPNDNPINDIASGDVLSDLRAGPDAKRFKSAMVSVPARHSLVLSATKTVIFNDRNVMMSSEKTNNSRRDFLVKSMR